MKIRKVIASVVVLVCMFSSASCTLFEALRNSNASNSDVKWEYLIENITEIKNVIILIGDGMGPVQIKAGEIYKGEQLIMQQFPYRANVNTNSLSRETDSAAAATAIATGKRTFNGIVGLDDRAYYDENAEAELETIVDIAAAMGKRTGVLTTEALHGATPMGFSAHNFSRNNSLELLESAAKNSNVNLFVSETFEREYYTCFTQNGYVEIPYAKDISTATEEKIFGAYDIKANGGTSFDYVVTEALEYLSQDEDGFFLMAEGAKIDKAGHYNDMRYMLEELLAFDDAIKAVLEWTKGRTDTVVIVTADHETGMLTLGQNVTHENILETDYGKPINYSWGSTGHTPTEVYCYINGVDIDFTNYSYGLSDTIKNTDIFEIMKALLNNDIN